MFGERDAATTAGDLELVEELELNTREEIDGKRERDSLQLKIPTTLEAGSATDRAAPPIQGTSKEVSSSAMTGTFDQTVRVGDIYLLALERSELDVPPTYALCQRCSLVRTDCFEATLTFFEKIQIS